MIPAAIVEIQGGAFSFRVEKADALAELDGPEPVAVEGPASYVVLEVED